MKVKYYTTRVLMAWTICCLSVSIASAQFSGMQPYRHEGGGLILNEMSNGPGATQEYAEFVVYGNPLDPTAPVDISGWIIDDNNYPQSGQGNAPGHIAFGDCYTAVPPGSILVIYHADDRNPALPPDDPDDTAPADGVYIIPHNAECLDACITNPNISNPLYCPCSDIDFIPQGWTLNLRNSGDAFQLRDPCETVTQVLSWGNVLVTDDVAACPGYIDLGPDSQQGRFTHLTNRVSTNWYDVANYENIAVSTLETPGAPNTPENAALINQLAAGTFTGDGRISDCRDTDAGDLLPPTDAGPTLPIELCLGEDIGAFARDYGQPDEMAPNAIGFDFEYTFLLTLDDAPEFTILEQNQEGDFDFSILPTGSYRVWGFSYIQTNGSVSVEEFVNSVTTVAAIQGYMNCGFDGDVGNDDPNGVAIQIDIINPQSAPPITEPIVQCADSDGTALFNLTTQDAVVLGGASGNVQWFADQTLISPIPDPTAYQTGSTTVYAQVGTSLCASDPASLDLVAIPPVNIRLVNQSDVSCNGAGDGSATFEFSGGTPPYQLLVDDSISLAQSESGTILLDDLLPGIHTLQITDAAGCSNQVGIEIDSATPLELDLGPDQTINAGEETLLSPTSNFDIAEWQWQPVGGLLSLSMLPTPAAPDTTTRFELTAFDANGCPATASVTIFVIPRREIYIPTAFSPNGDGRNDTFRLFSDLNGVLVQSFAIFDRWGDQVFQQEALLLDDRSLEWDGTFRGQPLDPGVFVFFAEVQFPDGETTIYEGDIVLVR